MEKCPFPLLVVNGYGTDIKCKFHEKTVYVFYIVAFQVVVALTLVSVYMNEVLHGPFTFAYYLKCIGSMLC